MGRTKNDVEVKTMQNKKKKNMSEQERIRIEGRIMKYGQMIPIVNRFITHQISILIFLILF